MAFFGKHDRSRKDKYTSGFKGGRIMGSPYWQHWKNVKIVSILQFALNTALGLLAIALCILLGKELFYIMSFSILTGGLKLQYQFLERILMFFLYFEFIALIVKYFQEEYHFPIRYFLYIGITAMIRLIVVKHENALYTLLFSSVVLMLIISFYIMNATSVKNGKY